MRYGRIIGSLTFVGLVLCSGLDFEATAEEQQGLIVNLVQNSGAGVSQSLGLVGTAGQRMHLAQVRAWCNNDQPIRVDVLELGVARSTTPYDVYVRETWAPSLTSNIGNGLTIGVSACASGGTSTLVVSAERW